MIEQQYYTREKRGIFSSTPGYDTIAKSRGLEDEFIKNTIHSLCFYVAPAFLAGEKDLSKYPKALFYASTGEGRIVIGQSVFAGKDYTLKRDRYFTHCYVVPENEKKIYIENPEKIIYSSGFAENYDMEKGTFIESLREIKIDSTYDVFNSIEDLFLAASMDKNIFINMVKACFDAAAFNKKIYIVLGRDKNVDKVIKGILKYLYRALPFAVRSKVGFITYVKQPEIKEFINIEFLLGGSIKRLTQDVKAGYVFDIADNSFYLDGIDERQHVFIDFVMNNIEDRKVLNEFFIQADNVCLEEKFTIDIYDNILCPSFQSEGVEKSGSCKNDSKQVEVKHSLKYFFKKLFLNFFNKD